MRGKALQKLEEGYMKFSENVLFASAQPTFLNKKHGCGLKCSARTCLEVSGWGVGNIYTCRFS